MNLETMEATTGGIFQGVINTFYQTMFNRRLQEIVTDSEVPPFSFAYGSKSELMDNIFYYRLTLLANHGEISAAYKRILLELKRVKEHGFLQKEFESAKKDLVAILENLEKEKNHVSNQEFAKSYVSHFSTGSPAVDVSKVLELKKNFTERVTLEQVNSWSKILTSNKGVIVSTLLPSSEAENASEEILKKANEEAAIEKVAPYENSFIERALLRHVPKAGKVVKETCFEKNCHYSLTTLREQEKTDPSSMELGFTGLPESIRDLNGKVLNEIKRLQTEGFTAEEVASYRAQVKEKYRKILDDDQLWVSIIANAARWNLDLNNSVEDFNRLLETFDEKMAQEQVKKLFPMDHYVQTTLFPKKAAK